MEEVKAAEEEYECPLDVLIEHEYLEGQAGYDQLAEDKESGVGPHSLTHDERVHSEGLVVACLTPHPCPADNHVCPVVQEGHGAPNHEVTDVAEAKEVDSHPVVQGHLQEVSARPVLEG